MTIDVWVPTTPCGTECKSLYDQIIRAMTGRQVQSAGHKGRSISYSEAAVGDAIKLYAQLRAQCPEAQANLPELKPLDQPATRGRALRVGFR